MPLAYPASRRSFYFALVFHNTLTSLRTAWAATDDPLGRRHVVAFCMRYFNEKNSGKCIGEIHLLSTSCPSVVAHECTHAAIHYLRLAPKRKKPPTDDEEPLCYVIQSLVKQAMEWQDLVREGKA